MNLIAEIEAEQIAQLGKDIPDFKAGDTVRVGYKVTEGTRSRVQNYEGVCIGRKGGDGIGASFTVRKISFGEGVERVFPLHSTNIDSIEVVRRGGSLGSAVMGASVKKGRQHYQNATRINGDDASTHWQYARALAALNARKYRHEIDTALTAAIEADASTALERVMQARAKKLQFALENQKRRAVEKLAAEML